MDELCHSGASSTYIYFNLNTVCAIWQLQPYRDINFISIQLHNCINGNGPHGQPTENVLTSVPSYAINPAMTLLVQQKTSEVAFPTL